MSVAVVLCGRKGSDTIDVTINGDVHIHGVEQLDKPVHKLRTSNAVTSAKKKVKARDNVCQCCGELPVNGHLEVHHIFLLAKYPSLASDEGNMIALCQKCHRKYHEMYDDRDVNAVTFAKFLKDYGNRRY